MKRSPLRRKSPLRADPEATRAWRDRTRSPLPAVGRKARREAAALREFRRALAERSGGVCEIRVSPACTGRATDAHHKCPADRDRGIHDPERGLHLCRACHVDWVHRFPERAYQWGYLLRDDGGGQ